MRTEIVLFFNATLLLWSVGLSSAGGDSQVAAQAAAAFFQRLVWAEAGNNFLLRANANLRIHGAGLVTAAEARSRR